MQTHTPIFLALSSYIHESRVKEFSFHQQSIIYHLHIPTSLIFHPGPVEFKASSIWEWLWDTMHKLPSPYSTICSHALVLGLILVICILKAGQSFTVSSDLPHRDHRDVRLRDRGVAPPPHHPLAETCTAGYGRKAQPSLNYIHIH